MQLSPVFLHLFTNRVERILHVKGNFTGPILEMTVVMDHSVGKEQMEVVLPSLLGALKKHSEVFRNVRMNIMDWNSDEKKENRVLPMMLAMGTGFYENYEQIAGTKRVELLYENLKLFHARSKLIIFVTDNNWCVADEKAKEEALKPFLTKKLLPIIIRNDEVELG